VNGLADTDSVQDCESIVKTTCAPGQSTSLDGNCVTDENAECAKQCGNSTVSNII
jgi:hypothetical protein